MFLSKEGTPNALRALIAEVVVPKIENTDGSRFFLAGEGLPEIDFEPLADLENEHHHFVEICFCLEGRAEIWIGERLKVIAEGDILILPANLSHSSAALHCVSCPPKQSFSRLLWLSPFPYGVILSACESRYGQHFGTPRQFFLTSHANPCFQNFFLELAGREHTYETMAKYNLLQALLWICRAEDAVPSKTIHGVDRVGEIQPPSKKDGIVEKVKDFIHQNYHTPLSLDVIARSIAVSKSSLCRSFKKETSLSVIDYLIKVRIDSAKRLLMSGLRIVDVARLVGFEDPYYFSRMFSKITGNSPSEFKSREIH